MLSDQAVLPLAAQGVCKVNPCLSAKAHIGWLRLGPWTQT